MREPNIRWPYSGVPNPMVGTGANYAETGLVWLTGLGGVVLTLFLAGDGWVGWSWWEVAIAAVIAFDLIGGAVANQLNSAKRFYHSPIRPDERGLPAFFKRGLIFPALHVHPIVIYLLFKPEEFLIGIAIYLGIALAAAITLFSPLYLARPVGTFFVVIAILVAAFAIRPIPGFDWLLPMLALKLVLGHAVREEPYRPHTET